MGRLRRWAVEDDAGQAVVELALSLPILLIVVLGMTQVGFALNTKQRLEGIAAQSARAYALTADPQRAIDVLRIAGEPLERFGDRATASLVVTRQEQRTVVQETPVTTCSGLFRRRCSTQYQVTTQTVASERTFLDVSGRVGGLRAPGGAGGNQRGSWVAVTVTYQFPNPIRPTFFQLPATFPLTTRAVARVEAPREGR